MMQKQDLINFSDLIAKEYLDRNLRVTFHLSGGNEDKLLDIFKDIKEGDYVLSTHRNHYHALLHGIPADDLAQRVIDGRSMYIFDRKKNFFTSCIIGGTCAIAAGIAWALKRKGSTQKVWCFIGDGTEDSGHFYEAARYVEGHDLPCTFIIEDNNMAVGATKKDRWGANASTYFSPSCVKRYSYTPTRQHIRASGKLDFSKASVPSNETLFPPLASENMNLNFDPDSDVSYAEAVRQSMEKFSAINGVHLGYSVKFGDAMGALKNVEHENKIETPVAENLMVGLALGMSMEGFRPVVYFERHDFMLCGADAIVNHANHIERVSLGEFKTPVTFRTIVTDGGPFYAGPTHSQNFTEAFRSMVSFPVYTPETGPEVLLAYDAAIASNRPSMIVERKSLF